MSLRHFINHPPIYPRAFFKYRPCHFLRGYTVAPLDVSDYRASIGVRDLLIFREILARERYEKCSSIYLGAILLYDNKKRCLSKGRDVLYAKSETHKFHPRHYQNATRRARDVRDTIFLLPMTTITFLVKTNAAVHSRISRISWRKEGRRESELP